MGKNKKKNGGKFQNDEYYENKERTQREYVERKNHDRKDMGDRRRPEKPEPHPVAKLMVDTFSGQILTFLQADTAQRKEFMEDLFDIKNYPSMLQGCEGAENYIAYLLERTVRENKREPDKLSRMSMSAVLLNKETKEPAFFVTCYIAPNEVGGVTVYEQGKNGTEYNKTLRWSSK